MEVDKPKYMDLLPKKLCILAKQKGFDYPTLYYYDANGTFSRGQKEWRWDKHHIHSILVPTIGTLKKWLQDSQT